MFENEHSGQYLRKLKQGLFIRRRVYSFFWDKKLYLYQLFR